MGYKSTTVDFSNPYKMSNEHFGVLSTRSNLGYTRSPTSDDMVVNTMRTKETLNQDLDVNSKFRHLAHDLSLSNQSNNKVIS